jgi:hypothetical protein
MAREPTTIHVLPNPWCAVDGEGRPAGACAVDPDVFGRRWIGAQIDRGQTKVAEHTPDELREMGRCLVAPRQTTRWVFATEPVAVAFSGERKAVMIRKLRNREVLPADKETARVAGVAFREPAAALAEERQRARARFDAGRGAGSFDEYARERGELPPEQPAPAPASAQPNTEPEPAVPAEKPKPRAARSKKDD